ncbi:hypothetical protein Zmor_025106 [Zophobas morio]|uniref:Uncharacterized protein n=1 Tax=Zophobas morio TaxID=2755281 RepID=A0AA38M3F0_9CUCU|nr:hypothetical protein Zmor_025106 [Zophobas morio]
MHQNKVLIFLALCLMVGIAHSIVCTPSFCASVQCVEIGKCDGPNQVVKPGGLCLCCNLCHTILRENEACSSIATILTGVPPPLAQCGQGLVCHEGKCQSFKSLAKTMREE